MHCLILSDTFPNRFQPWRGPYNRRQMESLAEFCNLTVIDPIPWPRILRDSRLRTLASQVDTVLPGVPIHHPAFFYLPVLGRARHWRGILSAARRALRRIRPPSFDLVFATFAYPHGLAAKHLASDLAIPCAIKVRGTDLHGLRPGTQRRKLTAEALRGAAAVIAVSGNLARIAQSLGAAPERVHILTNGIDARKFKIIPRTEARKRLNLPRDRSIALFVGSLLPVKGIDVLLKALTTTPLQALVAFAGKGPLQGMIEKHANNAPHSIRLLGQLDREEICLWMNAANLLVLPSRNEGCPNVVLESLACGTPVVASKVGAVPDLIDDACGIIVPPADPNELARAIHAAFSRRWNRADIRRKVEKRTWRDNARTLHRILAGLVTRTPNQ